MKGAFAGLPRKIGGNRDNQKEGGIAEKCEIRNPFADWRAVSLLILGAFTLQSQGCRTKKDIIVH